jgi:hypothetical protein
MEMPSRAMKLAVFFGSIHAGLMLTTISEASEGPESEAAVQVNDCLAAPDHQAAQGSRWYYRNDPATKHRCWYVRSDGQEIAQPGSSSARPAALASATLRRSVADAHAEIAPVPESLQSKSSTGSSASTVTNFIFGDIVPGEPQVSNRQSRIFANARAEAAKSNGIAGRHRPQPASAKRVGQQAARSLSMLLSALGGALALVGIITAVLARVGRRIAIRRRQKRIRSRRIWSPRPIQQHIPPPARFSDDAPMDWIRTARQAQEISRQGEQIEQLLARVSRRSAV